MIDLTASKHMSYLEGTSGVLGVGGRAACCWRTVLAAYQGVHRLRASPTRRAPPPADYPPTASGGSARTRASASAVASARATALVFAFAPPAPQRERTLSHQRVRARARLRLRVRLKLRLRARLRVRVRVSP